MLLITEYAKWLNLSPTGKWLARSSSCAYQTQGLRDLQVLGFCPWPCDMMSGMQARNRVPQGAPPPPHDSWRIESLNLRLLGCKSHVNRCALKRLTTRPQPRSTPSQDSSPCEMNRMRVTKIWPNVRVDFLVWFASKPLFYWAMTGNPSNYSEK